MQLSVIILIGLLNLFYCIIIINYNYYKLSIINYPKLLNTSDKHSNSRCFRYFDYGGSNTYCFSLGNLNGSFQVFRGWNIALFPQVAHWLLYFRLPAFSFLIGAVFRCGEAACCPPWRFWYRRWSFSSVVLADWVVFGIPRGCGCQTRGGAGKHFAWCWWGRSWRRWCQGLMT